MIRKRREYLTKFKAILDSISPQEFELIVLEAFARLVTRLLYSLGGDEGIDVF